MNERKAFNFYKSYFDVYNELSDDDKLLFMDALLKRQFYGEEPTNLKGQVKFAYISQKHNIDSQVNGYETKTKTKLSTPSEGGSKGATVPPSVQEEGKEEEEVQLSIANKNKLFTNTVWREDLLRHHNIDLEEYIIHLKDFIATESLDREFAEVQLHWKRWLNKRDLKTKKKPPVEHWNKDLPTGLEGRHEN